MFSAAKNWTIGFGLRALFLVLLPVLPLPVMIATTLYASRTAGPEHCHSGLAERAPWHWSCLRGQDHQGSALHTQG